MSRTKRIFISDIHMGTEDSWIKKYGWFWKKKGLLLGGFLTHLASDDTVAELVIVGDLFDEWVVPYGISPVATGSNQFDVIASAPQNRPVIQGLKQLIATSGVTVSYVPGNHDMLIQSGQLTKILPGIKPIIDPNVTGKGVYKSGAVHAEHGSCYDLFNAPDTYDTLQGATHHLPVGFFVARSQAEGVINGHPLSQSSVFKEIKALWNSWNKKDPLVTNIYDAIASLSHTNDQNIVMNGLDGIDQNIENTSDVTDSYGNVYDEWDQHMLDSVNATTAVVGATGMLRPAAILKYHSFSSSNIAIFGHTHKAEIKSGWLPETDESKEILKAARDKTHPNQESALECLLNLPKTDESGASGFIYVNTGTWITGDSGKPDINQRANYAVIEQKGSSTYASLYNYNCNDALYAPSTQMGSTYHVNN
ncbi:MAG: hypothetical protein GXP09_07180 [Gammaproteobacteria bacterium]|nr:hypothetical protein [Gammaproteobacteria bacterium]